MKVLLAAAPAAPELILQAETFLRVIPCFGGEKKGLESLGGGWGCVFFQHFLLPWWEKEENDAVGAHVAGRTEQKAGSSPALKFHKHLGLTGFLVCSFLFTLPALNGGEWVLVFAVTLISSPYP